MRKQLDARKRAKNVAASYRVRSVLALEPCTTRVMMLMLHVRVMMLCRVSVSRSGIAGMLVLRMLLTAMRAIVVGVWLVLRVMRRRPVVVVVLG